jgi:benzil reductase ((S)-benzoin forming)
MEKILIITGGSKGLGSGIIAAYLAANYRIFSISRTQNASEIAQNIVQIQADLSKSEEINGILANIFTHFTQNTIERIVLINNAATLGTITRAENYTAKDIENTLYLNTIAPLILISDFIRLTLDWYCTKKVINISSGAAQKAYYGWTNYCASKAALDMLTRAIAIEQNTLLNGVKLISIAPGIVDTDMQGEIRKATKSDFVEVERFVQYKNAGALVDAMVVGAKIFALDQEDLAENGAVLRVE